MVKRNIDEEFRSDVLVDIPKEHERRFGCSGKMLKPSRKSIEAFIKSVPRGAVLTSSSLRAVLAKRHSAQVTCPFLTKRALVAIAEDPKSKAPFWRVVMGNGDMIAAYPGGVTTQAKRLRSEGVRIASKGGKHRVADLRERHVAL